MVQGNDSVTTQCTGDLAPLTMELLPVQGRCNSDANSKQDPGRGSARGGGDPGIALSRQQQELLALYDNGTLLAEANRLTRISGNGRLRRSDGSFVDIGGSTGGYARTVLYDWQAPDLT